jgi:hypothetical protein
VDSSRRIWHAESSTPASDSGTLIHGNARSTALWRFRPAVNLRLTIVDFQFAKCHPGGSRTSLLWSETGRLPRKDVKNEGRSGNVYENKGSIDTMAENYSGFCAWLESFLQNWTTIDGSFWQKMRRKCGNWGEAGSRIGSAVYRPIDLSAGHGPLTKNIIGP